MERVFYPNDIITIVQVVVKALETFQIAKINVEDIFWIYSAYMIYDFLKLWYWKLASLFSLFYYSIVVYRSVEKSL